MDLVAAAAAAALDAERQQRPREVEDEGAADQQQNHLPQLSIVQREHGWALIV